MDLYFTSNKLWLRNYTLHRISEVKQIADRIKVLRDGENAGNLEWKEICHDAMVRLMVGRDISKLYQMKNGTPGQAVLEAKDLCSPGYPSRPLNFLLLTLSF